MAIEQQKELKLDIPISEDVAIVVVCKDFDDDPKILVAERLNGSQKGKYTLPGGKIEDESPTECAAREIFEETGLIINREAFIGGDSLPVKICSGGKQFNLYILFIFADEAMGDQIEIQAEPNKHKPWEWSNITHLEYLIIQGKLPPAVLAEWWLEVLNEGIELDKSEKELDKWVEMEKRGEIPAWILIPEEIRFAMSYI